MAQRILKPYKNFRITKISTAETTTWRAEDKNGYVYESTASLTDLKKRIDLSIQSKALGAHIGRLLGIKRQ